MHAKFIDFRTEDTVERAAGRVPDLVYETIQYLTKHHPSAQITNVSTSLSRRMNYYRARVTISVYYDNY